MSSLAAVLGILPHLVIAGGLSSCAQHPYMYPIKLSTATFYPRKGEIGRTALPVATQRLHGLSTSQLKCACLQFPHAFAT